MSLAWPGNISFSGTVSAPLFVSNQQIIAPFAAGTASTLTVNSLSSSFGSLLTAYTSTLSVGTILNFSAGGSIGTNLSLSGTLSSNSISSIYASFTSSFISTLTSSRLISGPALFNGNVSLASTAPLIGVATVNPGDMLVTTGYSNPMDRYGIGQYSNASSAFTRVFTSGYFGTNANLALSIAGSGSGPAGTFLDVLTVRGIAGLGTLSSVGLVGINNSAPSYTLDVNGLTRFNNSLFASISNAMMLLNQSQAGTASTSFSLYQGSAGDTAVNSASGSPLQFKVGNVEYARLSSAGLFGINTTAPAYNLDISGSARVSAGLQLMNGNQSTGTFLGTVLSQLQLQYAGGGGQFSHMIKSRHNGGAASGNSIDFVLWNYGTDSSTATLPTKYAMTIDGTGVGINTTTPAYALDITGSARVTSTLLLSNTLTSTQPLIVSSPMAQAQLLLSAGTGSTYRAARIDFFSGSSTSLPQWLMINDYNQTGINDFRICASNQASVIPITCLQNGNVGINTSNPAVGLDVAGSARVSGSLTASNINSQVVTVSISGPGQGLYVSNIPCYNTTGGGAVTVSCSYNYASGSSVAAGIYLLSQYQSTATTWSSSASTVYFLGGSNSWSFSNSNGFFAVTYPAGNNNFQFSINHV